MTTLVLKTSDTDTLFNRAVEKIVYGGRKVVIVAEMPTPASAPTISPKPAIAPASSAHRAVFPKTAVSAPSQGSCARAPVSKGKRRWHWQ